MCVWLIVSFLLLFAPSLMFSYGQTVHKIFTQIVRSNTRINGVWHIVAGIFDSARSSISFTDSCWGTHKSDIQYVFDDKSISFNQCNVWVSVTAPGLFEMHVVVGRLERMLSRLRIVCHSQRRTGKDNRRVFAFSHSRFVHRRHSHVSADNR